MPWRMVLEIGHAACEAGHETKVLSGRRHPTGDRWAYGSCLVEEIEKPYSNGPMDSFQRIIHREGFDVLFWPVAWCDARRQGGLLRRTSIPIVWYVPGACYLSRQAVRAMPDLGVQLDSPFPAAIALPEKATRQKAPKSCVTV